jgi:hypothetical protein
MSEAALKRAGIRHNDVPGSVIAPLCGLVDHFVRAATTLVGRRGITLLGDRSPMVSVTNADITRPSIGAPD